MRFVAPLVRLDVAALQARATVLSAVAPDHAVVPDHAVGPARGVGRADRVKVNVGETVANG